MATSKDEIRPYTPRRFNRTTRQRFTRDRWRRLVQHLGGHVTEVQKILLGRLIDLEWESARLSARRDEGEELSGHTVRAFMAMQNHIRLLSREIGLAGAKPLAPTLAEITADIERKRAAVPLPSREPLAPV